MIIHCGKLLIKDKKKDSLFPPFPFSFGEGAELHRKARQFILPHYL